MKNLNKSHYKLKIDLEKPDWKKVKEIKIIDNKEMLFSISDKSNRIIVKPQYFRQGLEYSLPECYCRGGVLLRLKKAADLLPAGYKLVIFDAWRPTEVQLTLFDRYKEKLLRKHPDKSEKAINKLTEQFVAIPSDNAKHPSPHITGGAVDLTIANAQGIFLDMGTEFDENTKKSVTNFLEKRLAKKGKLSPKEEDILYNRRLLYNIMKAAGFSNYYYEWWHYDYGNQLWAFYNKTQAFYGKCVFKLNSHFAFDVMD
ncbi:D-alanyl-D-alanine dipeptidase [Iocasia frigidifontis]|uniref:D-alanyl-D-alanine dipeptidase n=1 Tax=Iocasia fonsfrigidae TaxID=2682810 RepID=A0A8A7KCS8_9FIRM|nr:M15 family metallopeptidase [Iocasia fonsfrigidae]QTL97209.1 D-alanyl-D-alanine dipeptidase [Iocasia fonsfrigidae]